MTAVPSRMRHVLRYLITQHPLRFTRSTKPCFSEEPRQPPQKSHLASPNPPSPRKFQSKTPPVIVSPPLQWGFRRPLKLGENEMSFKFKISKSIHIPFHRESLLWIPQAPNLIKIVERKQPPQIIRRVHRNLDDTVLKLSEYVLSTAKGCTAWCTSCTVPPSLTLLSLTSTGTNQAIVLAIFTHIRNKTVHRACS